MSKQAGDREARKGSRPADALDHVHQHKIERLAIRPSERLGRLQVVLEGRSGVGAKLEEDALALRFEQLT